MRNILAIIFVCVFALAAKAQLYNTPGGNLEGISVVNLGAGQYQVTGNYTDVVGTSKGIDLNVGDVLWSPALTSGDTCRRFVIDSFYIKLMGFISFRVTDSGGQGAPSSSSSFVMREYPNQGIAFIPKLGRDDLIECISRHYSGQVDNISGGGSDGNGIISALPEDDVIINASGHDLIIDSLDIVDFRLDTLYLRNEVGSANVVIKTVGTSYRVESDGSIIMVSGPGTGATLRSNDPLVSMQATESSVTLNAGNIGTTGSAINVAETGNLTIDATANLLLNGNSLPLGTPTELANPAGNYLLQFTEAGVGSWVGASTLADGNGIISAYPLGDVLITSPDQNRLYLMSGGGALQFDLDATHGHISPSVGTKGRFAVNLGYGFYEFDARSYYQKTIVGNQIAGFGGYGREDINYDSLKWTKVDNSGVTTNSFTLTDMYTQFRGNGWKYRLPQASPSITDGVKQAMIWTGNGSTATPAFESFASTWIKPELEAGNDVVITSDEGTLILNQLAQLTAEYSAEDGTSGTEGYVFSESAFDVGFSDPSFLYGSSRLTTEEGDTTFYELLDRLEMDLDRIEILISGTTYSEIDEAPADVIEQESSSIEMLKSRIHVYTNSALEGVDASASLTVDAESALLAYNITDDVGQAGTTINLDRNGFDINFASSLGDDEEGYNSEIVSYSGDESSLRIGFTYYNDSISAEINENFYPLEGSRVLWSLESNLSYNSNSAETNFSTNTDIDEGRLIYQYNSGSLNLSGLLDISVTETEVLLISEASNEESAAYLNFSSGGSGFVNMDQSVSAADGDHRVRFIASVDTATADIFWRISAEENLGDTYRLYMGTPNGLYGPLGGLYVNVNDNDYQLLPDGSSPDTTSGVKTTLLWTGDGGNAVASFVRKAYGEASNGSTSFNVALGTSGTGTYTITNAAVVSENLADFTYASGVLTYTGTETADFLVTIKISGIHSCTNGQNTKLSIIKGASTEEEAVQSRWDTGEINSMTVTSIVNLSTTNTIKGEFLINQDAGCGNLTVYHYNITVVKL